MGAVKKGAPPTGRRSVNVVVLVGTVAADPITRARPDQSEVLEMRVSTPEADGRSVLPVPVTLAEPEEEARSIRMGDEVAVTGRLVRRFVRSGAGAHSVTEVVANMVQVRERGDR